MGKRTDRMPLIILQTAFHRWPYQQKTIHRHTNGNIRVISPKNVTDHSGDGSI